jgi:N-acetylmuramic acid 6-phosphate etherase
MVDVAVTNAKLEDRALRILADLSGIERNQAASLLSAAGGSVKLALLMQASGLDRKAASAALERHGPGLRTVLSALDYSLSAEASSQAPQ